MKDKSIMENKVKKELLALEENPILLITSKEEQTGKLSPLVIKQLVEKDYFCIYVSVNKPAKTILDNLEKDKVDTSQLFFIDCISYVVDNSSKKNEDNIISIETQDLTGISLAVNEIINNVKGKKVVVFDSLSTLLIYNNLTSLEKFSHFITNKIRMEKIRGIMLDIINDNNETITSLFKQVSDKLIAI